MHQPSAECNTCRAVVLYLSDDLFVSRRHGSSGSYEILWRSSFSSGKYLTPVWQRLLFKVFVFVSLRRSSQLPRGEHHKLFFLKKFHPHRCPSNLCSWCCHQRSSQRVAARYFDDDALKGTSTLHEEKNLLKKVTELQINSNFLLEKNAATETTSFGNRRGMAVQRASFVPRSHQPKGLEFEAHTGEHS